MKKDTYVVLAALGIGGFLLYRFFDKAKDIAEHALDSTTSAIASFWLKLFPLPPKIELLGNVKFPGNLLVPLQQIADRGDVRTDSEHHVFVKYADYVWQLSPQVNGNWPATRVE